MKFTLMIDGQARAAVVDEQHTVGRDVGEVVNTEQVWVAGSPMIL